MDLDFLTRNSKVEIRMFEVVFLIFVLLKQISLIVLIQESCCRDDIIITG